MINDVKITKASNNREYLNITLADIIVTWYNASGVAIGNSELLSEIESLYGLITIEDLVDNDIIVTTDITATKDDIKQAIGYGSTSVPYLRVDHRKLQTYLGGLPVDEVANKALTAMFSWENNPTQEAVFEALGIVVGNVVNIGKIGYNVIKDTLVENIHSLPLVQTLKDVYNNFTNSTYFQEIINSGEEVNTVFDYTPWTIETTITLPEEYMPWFVMRGNEIIKAYIMPPHVYAVFIQSNGNRVYAYAYNNTNTTKFAYPIEAQVNASSHIITIISMNEYGGQAILSNSWASIFPSTAYNYQDIQNYGPYILNLNGDKTFQQIKQEDPWGNYTTPVNPGISDYINKAVGNITKQNYINLAPNIGNGEYMFIFNKYQYDYVINQITNNTDNGDYSSNGDIITNYNTTYIQNPTTVDTRPTYIPAPTGQPIQPFISPRPTPIPEETEEAIYNGGIAESIKDKFPFCIPWDIQALITGLWSNNRQAPYIHWDARFGSWGKLGEVSIDLAPYDTAAQIFRSTTLLLWIIGLVVLTRNMIGS